MKGPFFRAHELASGKIPQIDAYTYQPHVQGSLQDFQNKQQNEGTTQNECN